MKYDLLDGEAKRLMFSGRAWDDLNDSERAIVQQWIYHPETQRLGREVETCGASKPNEEPPVSSTGAPLWHRITADDKPLFRGRYLDIGGKHRPPAAGTLVYAWPLEPWEKGSGTNRDFKLSFDEAGAGFFYASAAEIEVVVSDDDLMD